MPPKFMTLADLSKTDSTKKRKASSAFEGAGHTLSGKQTKVSRLTQIDLVDSDDVTSDGNPMQRKQTTSPRTVVLARVTRNKST